MARVRDLFKFYYVDLDSCFVIIAFRRWERWKVLHGFLMQFLLKDSAMPFFPPCTRETQLDLNEGQNLAALLVCQKLFSRHVLYWNFLFKYKHNICLILYSILYYFLNKFYICIQMKMNERIQKVLTSSVFLLQNFQKD